MAAAKGSRNRVWASFDRRKGAKAMSEGGAVNEGDDAQGGLPGVAAE